MRPIALFLGLALLTPALPGTSASADAADPDRPKISAGKLPRALTWLALGDSYSSGIGSSATSGGCGRSALAYPTQASKLITRTGEPRIEFDFRACTAARLRPGTIDEHGYPHHLPRQLTDAQRKKYNLITLTIGGNDFGFGDVIRSCYARILTGIRTKRACDFDPDELDRKMDRVGAQLAQDYKRKIIPRLSADGHVVVLGYPRLFADIDRWSGPTCNGILPRDAELLNAAGKRFIRVIRNAVTRTGATNKNIHFLDVQKGFGGVEGFDRHNLCYGKSDWLNAMTAKVAEPGKWLDASYHPTDAGYAAEARMLTAFVRNLDWRPLARLWLQVAEPGFGEANSAGWARWIPLGRDLWLNYLALLFGLDRSIGPATRIASGAALDHACPKKGYSAIYWGNAEQPAFGVLFDRTIPVGYRLYASSPLYSTGDGIGVGSWYAQLFVAYPGRVFQSELAINGERRIEYEIRGSSNGPLHGTVARVGGFDQIVARYAGEQCGLEESWEYAKSAGTGPGPAPGPGGKGGRLFRVGEYHWKFRPYSNWLHQDEKSSLTDLLVRTPVWEGTFRIDGGGNVSGSATSEKYIQTVRCADYELEGLTLTNSNAYIKAKAKLTLSGRVQGKQLKLSVRRHGFEMTQLGTGDKGDLVPKSCPHGVGLSDQGERAVGVLKRAFSGPPVQVTAQPNDFLRIWGSLEPTGGRCYPGTMTRVPIEGSDFEFTMYPSEQTDPRPHRIMPLAVEGKRGCA